MKNTFKYLHVRFFGHEPTERMQQFVRNLVWSFAGVIGSAGILFIVGISAGRILGPEEFGKYSLAISIANILAIFCAMGFDQASLKFVASSTDSEKQRRHFSNALMIVTGVLLVVAVLSLVFLQPLARVTGVPGAVVGAALAYAAVLGIRQCSEGYIRAVGLYRPQAMVKIAESFLSLGLFVLFFYLLKYQGFGWYVAVLSLAGLTTILIYFGFYLRTRVTRWDKQIFAEAWPYARSSFFISLVGIISLNIDRFFLNKNLGAAEVGIYAAYLLVPSMFASYFSTAVVNVFFPAANMLPDKKGLFRKLNRLALVAFVPIVAIFSCLGFVILSLFGSNYPIIPAYFVLNAVYGFLLMYIAIFAAIVGSSEAMYRKYSQFLAIKLVVVLVSYFSLSAAGLITIPILLGVLIAGILVDIVLLGRSLAAVTEQ